jgi:hypothetical protein
MSKKSEDKAAEDAVVARVRGGVAQTDLTAAERDAFMRATGTPAPLAPSSPMPGPEPEPEPARKAEPEPEPEPESYQDTIAHDPPS